MPFLKFVIPFALLALTVLSSDASASSYQVSPVKYQLSYEKQSDILTIRNPSDQEIRLQLSVFGWSQDTAGEIQLTPTKDLLFYPKMLVIPPHQSRIARVGLRVPVGAQEKTYRIVFDELPAKQHSDKSKINVVNILTRMTIPIIVQPKRPSQSGLVHIDSIENGKVTITLKNTGNILFFPSQITVTGFNSSGLKPVVAGQLKAWYVLAGASRKYAVALPAGKCASMKRFHIKVTTEDEVYSDSHAVTPQSCVN